MRVVRRRRNSRRILANVNSSHTSASHAAEPGDLLPLVAAGDSSVVQLAVDRYAGLVWSLARRWCETEADAEDAVQDIFLDIWKSAGRFDSSVASETTFVSMIARRRLIDRRRRIGRRPKGEALVPEAHVNESEPELGAEQQLSDDASKAARAMEELSAEQRRVLRLSIFHGLSHDKIASATGMPLGTVKTHARRGLIKLRKVLGAHEQAEASASGSTGVQR
jgi:RNA polymerase sigma-70 factor (ECF subfamily)